MSITNTSEKGYYEIPSVATIPDAPKSILERVILEFFEKKPGDHFSREIKDYVIQHPDLNNYNISTETIVRYLTMLAVERKIQQKSPTGGKSHIWSSIFSTSEIKIPENLTREGILSFIEKNPGVTSNEIYTGAKNKKEMEKIKKEILPDLKKDRKVYSVVEEGQTRWYPKKENLQDQPLPVTTESSVTTISEPPTTPAEKEKLSEDEKEKVMNHFISTNKGYDFHELLYAFPTLCDKMNDLSYFLKRNPDLVCIDNHLWKIKETEETRKKRSASQAEASDHFLKDFIMNQIKNQREGVTLSELQFKRELSERNIKKPEIEKMLDQLKDEEKIVKFSKKEKVFWKLNVKPAQTSKLYSSQLP